MEPPPFGDGNRIQWECVSGSVSPFNGATALRRWKQDSMEVRIRERFALQWSHRPSAMETGFNGSAYPGAFRPSMEPPPFGDGNPASPATTPASTFPFNGATALRRWKPARGPRRRVVGAPSMEPPPFGDGNQVTYAASDIGMAPSMEPPPFGDGNDSSEDTRNRLSNILQWSHRPSAMETIPGNLTGARRYALQWSHRPSAMETIPGNLTGARRYALQWSHRPSAMETMPRPAITPATITAFNGATALRRWKLGYRRQRRDQDPPSMEPPPFGDGNSVTGVSVGTRTHLQWSHRPSAMETGGTLDSCPKG